MNRYIDLPQRCRRWGMHLPGAQQQQAVRLLLQSDPNRLLRQDDAQACLLRSKCHAGRRLVEPAVDHVPGERTQQAAIPFD